jgi:hypothetical protein
MPTTPQPLPMFGAWNEHWKNHPARLPVSQYKPNTNPNTGAASVDAAWAAANPAPAATPPPSTPPTPAPVSWNQWYVDYMGAPPASPGTPSPAPMSSAANPAQPASFASQYTPAMQQQVYENPWYILPDVFQGIAPTSPLYQSLRDMGADPLALYNVMQGSQGKTGNDASYIDWLADFFKKQTTAAPNQASPQNLLSMIFGQEKFGAESPNTLGQILGAGDMSTQVRTLYNLAKDSTNLSMNPKTARAYQAALAQSGDTYGTEMLGSQGGTGVQNISQWIKQYAPWLGLGG